MGSLQTTYRKKPGLFYSMSIAATWAGAGSFIVGTQVAKTAGLFPWLLWALGNTLTCIVFGIVATKCEYVRRVAKSKPIQILMGLMCVFQIWVNMGGVYEMLSETVIGPIVSRVIAYALALFFVMLYLKKSTYRNVMTDNGSWTIVYGLIFLIVIVSLLQNGFRGIPTVIEMGQIKAKGWTCITLMFGGFFYPTFWELLDYNDKNEDDTQKTDMKQAFIRGGLLFGFYLLFVLLGANTEYSESLTLVKAILVSLVAISSLSSFLYGAMINFGKKVGVVIDLAAIAGWQLLVPIGVMGVWNIMQNTRIWMVFGMFAIAIAWKVIDRRKKK